MLANNKKIPLVFVATLLSSDLMLQHLASWDIVESCKPPGQPVRHTRNPTGIALTTSHVDSISDKSAKKTKIQINGKQHKLLLLKVV